MKEAKKFVLFDYGKKENLKRYNQAEPLEIPLHNISKVPIAMLMGDSDTLAPLAD